MFPSAVFFLCLLLPTSCESAKSQLMKPDDFFANENVTAAIQKDILDMPTRLLRGIVTLMTNFLWFFFSFLVIRHGLLLNFAELADLLDVFEHRQLVMRLIM